MALLTYNLPATWKELTESAEGKVAGQRDNGGTAWWTMMRLLLLNVMVLVTVGCGRPETELVDAACRGDAEKVRALVKRGDDVNARGKFGDTALHWVALHGDEETMVFLIAQGADIEIRNGHGSTPILKAVTPECVATLHKHGARVDAVDDCGRGLIDWASMISSPQTQQKALAIIEFALACGVDISREDYFRRTPLDYMVMRDNREMAAYLVSVGCRPGSRGDPPYPDWALQLVQKVKNGNTGEVSIGYRGPGVGGGVTHQVVIPANSR
ncbi:MAG: ankyrin repeat domain-containing protein [Kiritimatiellae bacterium]|nr:ankyrin repeat domain-containing protein [Kiritimatiellia bacterium]